MKRSNFPSTILFVFLALLLSGPLQAAKPRHWVVSTQEGFLKGDFKNVSVTSDGRLILAPAVEPVLDSEEALIHSSAVDNGGNLYVGTGNNARIYRVPRRGEGSLWADLEGTAVMALTVGSLERIYAATSPAGKVYRLDSGGQPELLFDPRTKYIWDLAVDDRDNLFVATGPKGVIHRVDSAGQASVFYDSSETHVTSLGWDIDGNLLAGTVPGGLLVRITPAGKPFVLHDSSLKEIKGITHDRYGNIFAIGLDYSDRDAAETKNQTTFSSPRTTASTGSSSDENGFSSVSVEGVRKGKRLEIYRIDRGGLVETLYSADSKVAFDLLTRDDGRLLVATGDKGRILSISPNKMLRLLVQTPAEQVTRLINVEGTLFAATSNLGKVFRLRNNAAEKATYESDVLDGEMTCQWGAIRWRRVDPLPPTPSLFSRSGNTGKPDATWSDWSPVEGSSDAGRITSPAARYLQWKIEFPHHGSDIPILSERNAVDSVAVSYLQRNMSPRLTKLTVYPPGAAFTKPPATNNPGTLSLGGPDNAHLFALPAQVRALGGPKTVPPPQQIYIPGARSITWTAQDPNRDDLYYSIYYRGQNERRWKLLTEKRTDNYYTLDGASLPDGVYLFRVVASDSPSNPAKQALEGELVSKPFVIANSPPQIDLTTPQPESGAVVLNFTAQTRSSTVHQAEYSIDAGPWQIIYPTDGIADSKSETFSVRIENVGAGDHLVSIRTVDSVGNLGTAKTSFTVP